MTARTMDPTFTAADVQAEHKRSGILLYACDASGYLVTRLFVGWCQVHAVAEFVAEMSGEYVSPTADADCGCW